MFIDREYRTKPDREHTAAAGTPLGGLISLHMAVKYPDTFSRCAAISPALWWNKGAIFDELRQHREALRRVRGWADMGTREGMLDRDSQATAVTGLRELVKVFDDAGMIPGRDYYAAEVFGAEH